LKFKNASLGRIDVYYDRELKKSDRGEYFEAFLNYAIKYLKVK